MQFTPLFYWSFIRSIIKYYFFFPLAPTAGLPFLNNKACGHMRKHGVGFRIGLEHLVLLCDISVTN